MSVTISDSGQLVFIISGYEAKVVSSSVFKLKGGTQPDRRFAPCVREIISVR